MHIQEKCDSIFLCDDCEFSSQYEDRLSKHIQSTHEAPSRFFYSNPRNKYSTPTSKKEKSYAQAAGGFSSDPLLCEFKTNSIAELRSF